MRPVPVVIAAGGTGGHMFPALALAAELRRRGRPVVLVCDDRGARYVGEGTAHRLIRAGSPSGRLGARIAGLGRLAVGLGQSLMILRQTRPLAVAAFGGYAAAPVGVAAAILRVPLLVHEQNAVLGRANRLSARRAARLALTFEATRGAEIVPAERRVVTGNPVRTEVAALRGTPYRPAASDQALSVLVVGGSQGARILSEVVPAAIARLTKDERARIALTQQCRPDDLERVASAYAGLGFRAELASFFEDLPQRMAASHLVISRAGASTVAELLALGRPALLVPFRFAAEDHQQANAEAVRAAGAGWLIEERGLDAEALAGRIRIALEAPQQLAAMAACAAALGRVDAAGALADALLALAAPASIGTQTEALA
jgi:UDP-N-acetylglucosamine--N-acetylmuramyl-(pentapeptide) pyrophosphoryl-undecaprenol N-acetylglucosamine transferase